MYVKLFRSLSWAIGQPLMSSPDIYTVNECQTVPELTYLVFSDSLSKLRAVKM